MQETPKYKVGDLVDFVYGSGWRTKSQIGIIIKAVDRGDDGHRTKYGERFSYECYGQITGHCYWVYERELKLPEESWKLDS